MPQVDEEAQVYRFLADRLQDTMRQDYPTGGTAAVAQYSENFRAAQRVHHALLDARALGDTGAAGEHRQALIDLAQAWADHEDYPLR